MLYTETEKKEIERAYEVFADYIRESPYLEGFCSDKLGYVLLKGSVKRRYVDIAKHTIRRKRLQGKQAFPRK